MIQCPDIRLRQRSTAYGINQGQYVNPRELHPFAPQWVGRGLHFHLFIEYTALGYGYPCPVEPKGHRLGASSFRSCTCTTKIGNHVDLLLQRPMDGGLGDICDDRIVSRRSLIHWQCGLSGARKNASISGIHQQPVKTRYGNEFHVISCLASTTTTILATILLPRQNKRPTAISRKSLFLLAER